MSKVWTIALREYRTNVKTKAFIIAVVLMPVFMGGSILVQAYFEKKGDQSIKKLAVIDYTGRLISVLDERAAQRNEKEIFDPDSGAQVQATFDIFEIPATDEQNPQARRLAVSDRVRSGEFFAFVEIGRDVFGDDLSSPDAQVRYFSSHSAYRDLPQWIRGVLTDAVTESRLERYQLDRDAVRRALAPISVEQLGLVEKTEAGEIKEAQKADPARTFLVPFAALMLMWMLLMVATQPLLHGALEEKMQRIAEVMLGSAPPFTIMMGKLIGHVLVALTLLAIYLVGGFMVADRYGYGDALDPTLVAWFLAYLTIAVFMFGSLFLAVGASVNDIKEAQSLLLPVMFPMIIPMFFIIPIIKDPSGAVATTLSLIPFTAPQTMIMRLAMETPVPPWQPVASIAGCIAATLLFVWAAGRVFRVGLLMQGQAPKIGTLIRWVVHG